MNYTDTLNYIHSLGNFGLPSGLDRIKTVLEKLGNPQNELKAIHIAGTNGKGSVTEMITNVLIKEGYKVGKFISPHLIHYNERISVNNNNISDSEMEVLINIINL